jgi:hypothetical protein
MTFADQETERLRYFILRDIERLRHWREGTPRWPGIARFWNRNPPGAQP